MVDPIDRNHALAERLGVKFPILSDPNLAVIRSYGLEHEGEDISLPATYVVRQDSTVALAYVGDNPRDRPSVDDVIAALGG